MEPSDTGTIIYEVLSHAEQITEVSSDDEVRAALFQLRLMNRAPSALRGRFQNDRQPQISDEQASEYMC